MSDLIPIYVYVGIQNGFSLSCWKSQDQFLASYFLPHKFHMFASHLKEKKPKAKCVPSWRWTAYCVGQCQGWGGMMHLRYLGPSTPWLPSSQAQPTGQAQLTTASQPWKWRKLELRCEAVFLCHPAGCWPDQASGQPHRILEEWGPMEKKHVGAAWAFQRPRHIMILQKKRSKEWGINGVLRWWKAVTKDETQQ